MSLTGCQKTLTVNKTIVTLFLLLIKAYQYIVSPVLTPACRFYPTCSNYACDALTKYGPIKGIWLAFKRVLKCHPFHPGGVDQVP